MHAKLQIVLNAVEKGSNPWGCTDYLNQKKKILETGGDVYEKSFPQPARPALWELQSLYEKIKLIQTTGGNAVSVSIRAS